MRMGRMGRSPLDKEEALARKRLHTRIGKKFKKLREDAGVTQQSLADEMELTSPQYISNIERGASPPSRMYLKTLIKKTGLKKEDIAYFLATEYQKFFMEELS